MMPSAFYSRPSWTWGVAPFITSVSHIVSSLTLTGRYTTPPDRKGLWPSALPLMYSLQKLLYDQWQAVTALSLKHSFVCSRTSITVGQLLLRVSKRTNERVRRAKTSSVRLSKVGRMDTIWAERCGVGVGACQKMLIKPSHHHCS